MMFLSTRFHSKATTVQEALLSCWVLCCHVWWLQVLTIIDSMIRKRKSPLGHIPYSHKYFWTCPLLKCFKIPMLVLQTEEEAHFRGGVGSQLWFHFICSIFITHLFITSCILSWNIYQTSTTPQNGSSFKTVLSQREKDIYSWLKGLPWKTTAKKHEYL
jgi:hypothetical protein